MSVFRWQRDGLALTSTCTLCGMATRSLSESAIYATQRAHSWQECARRRAEARVVPEPVVEPDADRCRNGHERAGNTRIDKRGHAVCNACRREIYAAQRYEKAVS